MKNVRQPVDKVFLALVLLELFFGLVMLTSASMPISYDHFIQAGLTLDTNSSLAFWPGPSVYGRSRALIIAGGSAPRVHHAGRPFFDGFSFVPFFAAGYGTAKAGS